MKMTWDYRYERLAEFVYQYGKFPVEGDLRTWVYRQKWQRKNAYLAQAKRVKLEKILGWNWEYTNNVKWEEKCQKLKRFVLTHKRFPLKFESLYVWVSSQRTFYHSDRMNSKRVSQLEKIKGWEWKLAERRRAKGYRMSNIEKRQSEKRQNVIKLKQDGWSVSRIATYLGCSRQNVYGLLGGVGVRPYGFTK